MLSLIATRIVRLTLREPERGRFDRGAVNAPQPMRELLSTVWRIPAYRLSGDASLPGLGPIAGVWRASLGEVVREALGSGLLVDLRSTTYAAFWRPDTDLARRVVTVRVLHETGGRRTVVSHFNKATKGRLVRSLLEDGANPGSVRGLAAALERLGWHVEVGAPGRSGTPLDVVVAEV